MGSAQTPDRSDQNSIDAGSRAATNITSGLRNLERREAQGDVRPEDVAALVTAAALAAEAGVALTVTQMTANNDRPLQLLLDALGASLDQATAKLAVYTSGDHDIDALLSRLITSSGRSNSDVGRSTNWVLGYENDMGYANDKGLQERLDTLNGLAIERRAGAGGRPSVRAATDSRSSGIA